MSPDSLSCRHKGQPVVAKALFIVIVMVAAGHAQTDAATPQRPVAPPVQPPQPGFQPIQKPADPAQVRGTYELDGKTITVTEGEFFEVYELLKPHEERPQMPLQPQRIMEHILLIAEARSLGLEPDDAELDLINPAKNPTLGAQIKDRWKQQGISEAQYLRYLRETRAIQRMKDLVANAGRVRSSQIFEDWKRDNHLYRLAYLEFKAAPFVTELKKSPPEDAVLKSFWSTNAQVQDKYRSPTSVTADIIIFSPQDVTDADFNARKGDRKISRAEAQEYFVKHRDRLLLQIPSDQRPKLYPPAGQKPSLKDIATPFQILLPQIERELVLGDSIQKAKAEATAKGTMTSADMKALAETHKLKHLRFDRADRRVVSEQHSNLGFQLFTDLFNAAPGSFPPGVIFQNGLHYFWRLEDKAVSTLPPFEEVRGKIISDYYETESFQRALQAAKSLLDSIGAEVSKETGTQDTEIDKRFANQAEDEIKSKNITDEAQRESVRQRSRQVADMEKRKLHSGLAPRHFDTFVKAKGLAIKETEPFSFSMGGVDRSLITDQNELVSSFLKSSYQIRSQEAGTITPILSDVLTNAHYIVKVVSKEEPTFQAMPAMDYHQRRQTLERQAMYSSNFRWSIFQVQNRLKWKSRDG